MNPRSSERWRDRSWPAVSYSVRRDRVGRFRYPVYFQGVCAYAVAGCRCRRVGRWPGTRLRPLTLSAPKPMLPTAGVPFLEHLLSRIAVAGITHVILGTSYRADTFSGYFGDGADFGLDIDYVFESEPLGTGGGIRNVHDHLRADTVMVFNGDVLSGVDLPAIVATHRANRADVTLHLVKVADPRAFGSVPTSPDGRVKAFLRRPTIRPPTRSTPGATCSGVKSFCRSRLAAPSRSSGTPSQGC
jgi:NDP-sugar pyrophosphorylase family protein